MKAREWRVSRALAGAVLLVALALGCGDSEEPEQQAAPAPRGPDIAEQITTETGVEMVLIPAGEFIMGDDGGEDDEKPAHRVRLSALYIDKHEVTQRHYEGLMGRNPSKRKEPDSPVEQVSWRAAVKYCNMRSLREGLQVCYDPETLECDFSAGGYRLPTAKPPFRSG